MDTSVECYAGEYAHAQKRNVELAVDTRNVEIHVHSLASVVMSLVCGDALIICVPSCAGNVATGLFVTGGVARGWNAPTFVLECVAKSVHLVLDVIQISRTPL